MREVILERMELNVGRPVLCTLLELISEGLYRVLLFDSSLAIASLNQY